MNNRPIHGIGPVFAALTFVFVTFASQAFAGANFTLSGSSSRSNFIESNHTQAGSASLGFDFATYFRIGVTHRQEYEQKEGFAEDTAVSTEDEKVYKWMSTNSRQIANSLDLTIVLYNGQNFVPFIFGGAVHKQYTSEFTKDDVKTTVTPPPMTVPNGGGGFSLPLNQRFSLRFSHTVSPGILLKPDGTTERTLDSYSQLGITYQM
jgi:hypothetical protein